MLHKLYMDLDHQIVFAAVQRFNTLLLGADMQMFHELKITIFSVE